jgi:hypothetical protein
LYGDFLCDDESAFMDLAAYFKAARIIVQPLSQLLQTLNHLSRPRPELRTSQEPRHKRTIMSTLKVHRHNLAPSRPPQITPPSPPRAKFLALCVDSGGTYKTLCETDVSQTVSDAEAFLHMKRAYLQSRTLRSRLNILLKQVAVEFVRVRHPVPFTHFP